MKNIISEFCRGIYCDVNIHFSLAFIFRFYNCELKKIDACEWIAKNAVTAGICICRCIYSVYTGVYTVYIQVCPL